MSSPACASILAVGDELVLGQSVDTNSSSVSARLVAHGMSVCEHVNVPDDRAAIADAIRRLARHSRLLIVTGGLGPTADDLTRAALADALGEPLVEDADALATIQAWFSGRGRSMPEPNRVQALRPRSARMLPNENGTAPGLMATVGGCDVFCLPGPPGEMLPMLEREVIALLQVPQTDATRVLFTVGRGESDIAVALGELMDRDRSLLVGTTASFGTVAVRLRDQGDGPGAAARLDQAEAEIRRRLGPIIFSVDRPLSAYVLDRLRGRHETLGCVESCTGGGLGAAVTEIAGSSDVFVGGLITYTNALKQTLAHVPQAVLEEHGAVSGPCARAMAEGGRSVLGVDHALAVTGIAGPGGGSDDKPVGTVWIALASVGADTDVRHFRFRGSRDNIRRWSVSTALAMLRLRLDSVAMALLNEAPPHGV